MKLLSQLFFWPLCTLSLLPGTLKAETSLPLTSEKVGEYLLRAQGNVIQTEEKIIAVPSSAKTYANTLRPWNALGNDILLNFSILTYLAQGNFRAAYDAYQAIQQLQGFLYYSLILNHEMQSAMIDYAHSVLLADRIPDPYENYLISCILDSCEEIKPAMIPHERQQLERLQSLYGAAVKTPYLYLKGGAAEKILPSAQDPFTVLNLNTCFLPGELVYVHGGVALWQQRVEAIADKIISSGADVICLQEMFTEDACHALYEELKEHYSHFYVAIGPRPLGFSPATFGLPSGLFVASKFSVEDPHFTPFAVTGYQMNYGFFDFVIKSADTPLAHLYSTHLQSLNEEQFPQIRAAELMQIIEKMQNDGPSVPRIACGDFNIPWGSGEPGESLIRAYFYDDYNHGRTEFSEGQQTCTDYFIDRFFASIGHPQPIGANLQIIDYALLFQPAALGCTIQTVLIPMNRLSEAESAVSDHNGLLTTVKRSSAF
ncbi:MAG: endonuclease/exonuclease/phosphatase family protein [Verrucomicrobia bacterium]|nr:endonuclease/exonuclease/phosphatase family protein [Verrucomicrobiota bacterium]